MRCDGLRADILFARKIQPFLASFIQLLSGIFKQVILYLTYPVFVIILEGIIGQPQITPFYPDLDVLILPFRLTI